MKKKKEWSDATLIGLGGVLLIGGMFIGFMLGLMWVQSSIVTILEAVDVEEINIDLNETQIVDAAWDKIEHTTNLTRPETK